MLNKAAIACDTYPYAGSRRAVRRWRLELALPTFFFETRVRHLFMLQNKDEKITTQQEHLFQHGNAKFNMKAFIDAIITMRMPNQIME